MLREAHEHPEWGLEQLRVDSSYLTGQLRRIGISKRWHLCLYGLRFGRSLSLERHPFSRLPRSTEWSSRCISASVTPYVRGRPADWPICLHSESLRRRRDTQSCSRSPRQSLNAVGQGSVTCYRGWSCRRLVASTTDHSRRSQTRRQNHQSRRGTSTGRENLWATHLRLSQKCQRKRTSWLGWPQERRTRKMAFAAQRRHLERGTKSWLSIKAIKESTWLLRDDRKRPDGVTLIPCAADVWQQWRRVEQARSRLPATCLATSQWHHVTVHCNSPNECQLYKPPLC